MTVFQTLFRSLAVVPVLLCLFVAVPNQAAAQVEVEKSSIVKEIDGKRYYIHEVKPQQNLFRIAQAYGIDQQEIVLANPGAAQALSIGQKLRIPLSVDAGTQQASAAAPPSQASTEGDGEYIIHTVKPQETIYGLTKLYGISEADLRAANPDLADGLKLGMELRIPAMKTTVSEPAFVPPVVTEQFIGHEVQPGETLWGIAQMYGVSTDSIKAANSAHFEHFGNLQQGYKILIPKEHKSNEGYVIKESLSDADTVQFLGDSIDGLPVFNVALMLPFYLDINDTINAKAKPFDPATIHPKSAIALQFYQGAMLAVDSMRKRGLCARLYVYDTANDTARVDKLLEQPEMSKMDVIIGPLFRTNVMRVVEWAKPKGIQVVCPVPQPNRILLGNDHVSKVVPSLSVQVEQLAAHVVRKHLGSNIVVLTGKGVRENALATNFVGKCHQALEFIEVDSTKMPTRRRISKFYTDSLKRFLRADTMNVLVVPSGDQTWSSQLLSGLRRLAKDYRITVYGLENWQNFTSIDVDYIHAVNLHVAAGFYVDYESPKTQKLMRQFRKNYRTDPDKYGYLGFDVTTFWLNALRTYGDGYKEQLTRIKQQGISTGFAFFKTGLESGLENKAVYILRYENYNLVKAN